MIPFELFLVVLVGLLIALVFCAILWTRSKSLHSPEELQRAREQSVKQSKATRGGHDAERILPWLPGFDYSANDARFMGGPIDFVVFDGLETNEVREIVFVEVKTGKATLSQRERQVRDAIIDQRVRHEVVRVAPPTAADAARVQTIRSKSQVRVRQVVELSEGSQDGAGIEPTA